MAQAAGSPAFVPSEVVNQWEDWVHGDPGQRTDHSVVYNPDEVEALGSFHSAWESAAERMPSPLPQLIECQALTEWHDLQAAASAALAVFAHRGRLSDDEVDPTLDS